MAHLLRLSVEAPVGKDANICTQYLVKGGLKVIKMNIRTSTETLTKVYLKKP